MPDPSTPSRFHASMRSTWDKIDTVLAGTEAMRAAGEMFMPRHPNEDSQAYEERRVTATLLNLTEITLDSWVGRPFSRPVTVSERVPEALRNVLRDVDLGRQNVTTFARNWFREGLAKMTASVLVDAPIIEEDRLRTRLDDSREGRRPFWGLIAPENLLFVERRELGGQDIIVHARILEVESQRVGFQEIDVIRIRQFDRVLPGEIVFVSPDDAEPLMDPGVYVTVWRRIENEKGDVEWVKEAITSRLDDRMDEIPLVEFRVGDKPPLKDLVDLNVNHWQSNSDQNTILTVTRFPLLALSGGDEDEVVTEIGPRRMLFTPDPRGKFYYVEHEGAAISAGRQHLLDLEDRMARYGAEFMRRRPDNNPTATARLLDSAESTSPLQDAALRFEEALQAALQLTGKWLGLEETGELRVHSDFEAIADRGNIEIIDRARARGDISLRDYLEELRARGALRQDFDLDENEARLRAEPRDE